MAPRIADRLDPARRSSFVDREHELERYCAAVASDTWPWQVILLHGPGGLGKTTLLHQFRNVAEEADPPIPVGWVDCRRVQPEPDAVRAAVCRSLGIEGEAPLDKLVARTDRFVVIFDTWDRMAALEPWFRDDFLPALPVGCLTILAGRNAPSPDWRRDPGWRELCEQIALRFLSRADAHTYLARRQVPEIHRQAIIEFTLGHPLALSLAAATCLQQPDAAFQPASSPDLVAAVLGLFVEDVPSPAHRAALEISALVHTTTEDLLTAVLPFAGHTDATGAAPEAASAPELFSWLRDLSMVESGPRGLFPHDLARRTLMTELRWRGLPSCLHMRASSTGTGCRARRVLRSSACWTTLSSCTARIRSCGRSLTGTFPAADGWNQLRKRIGSRLWT